LLHAALGLLLFSIGMRNMELGSAEEVSGHTGVPAAARLRADRQLLRAVSSDMSVMFLDIETTGLSRYYDQITLVGYMIDGRYHVHISGDDPAPLLAALDAADTLVTFNGTLFDVPFLLQTFADAVVPAIHVDLRYATRRLGLSGGQKVLEQHLGIDVREGLGDVDGAEAVILWHRYLRGDLEALRRLLRYNQADVLGMGRILDHVVDQVLHRDLLIESPRFGEMQLELFGYADPTALLPHPRRLNRKTPTFDGLFSDRRAGKSIAVGVDLTGSETKPSGFCVLDGAHATTQLIGPDDDMVAAILAAKPDIVSIDSPLCLPRGRIHVGDDDPGRATYGIMRQSERTLKRRGINVYPCLLPSMQRLTERGIRLANRLRKMGVPVIESYPGAAQDIMGIPRKGAGIHWLQQGLAGFGITGAFVDDLPSHDELDAITSALVGTFLLNGRFEALGGEGESPLIVPDVTAAPRPLVIGVSGRIAAGKTTAARWIEAMGFAYTRFSLVIDDEIRALGLPLDRPTRQRLGIEIHDERGQAWLCERTISRVGDAQRIVVDGLRWPEDHAYLVEQFGDRFIHLHLKAPAATRFARLGSGPDDRHQFDVADGQPVEAMIDTLATLASRTVENVGLLEQFETEVRRIVAEANAEAE
jgi:predicted nuclease with RNAse H fold/dephospho-CoA kinase